MAKTETSINRQGVFVRRMHIDGALLNLKPQSLRHQIHSSSRYSSLSGNLGQGRVYGAARQVYFWSDMAHEVYNTACSCKSSAENRNSAKHRRHFHPFLAADPLQFVAIDTLRPLPKTTKRNQHFVIFKDRYSKLMQAVLLCGKQRTPWRRPSFMHSPSHTIYPRTH